MKVYEVFGISCSSDISDFHLGYYASHEAAEKAKTKASIKEKYKNYHLYIREDYLEGLKDLPTHTLKNLIDELEGIYKTRINEYYKSLQVQFADLIEEIRSNFPDAVLDGMADDATGDCPVNIFDILPPDDESIIQSFH